MYDKKLLLIFLPLLTALACSFGGDDSGSGTTPDANSGLQAPANAVQFQSSMHQS